MNGLQLPDPTLQWPVPLRVVHLIAEKEQGPRGGTALRAYLCPAGKWTIGWGRITNVKAGDTCTKAQADAWLRDELAERRLQVESLLTRPATINELGALVSLQYNIGQAALARSSVIRLHNAGRNIEAAEAFKLWNKARVQGVLTVLPGLVSRRAAEAALYLEPDAGMPALPMPQAVEPEQRPAASVRVQTGAATAALGLVGMAGELKETLGPVGETAAAAKGFLSTTLGIPTQWVPLALLVLVGGFLIWHFHKQRRQGIA